MKILKEQWLKKIPLFPLSGFPVGYVWPFICLSHTSQMPVIVFFFTGVGGDSSLDTFKPSLNFTTVHCIASSF